MIFGSITNSWKQQICDQDFTNLIREARIRGARHIELRQSSMGDLENCEDDKWRPEISRLKEIISYFPDINFNLAINWPCLSMDICPSGKQFQAALQAAKVIDRNNPHLRIVDSVEFKSPWEKEDQVPRDIIMSVIKLIHETASQKVKLSIENVGQPIRSMNLLIKMVQYQISLKKSSYLGLCPDPINQLLRFPNSDPISELEALPIDIIKIVHFKQTRKGRPHSTIDIGDIDCIRQLKILESKKYEGPCIMEIPPHKHFFDNLSTSFSFLRNKSIGAVQL